MSNRSCLPATMRAGLLLAARAHLQSLGLPCPTSKDILRATGAGRSRAYVCRDAILGMSRQLSCKPGRPSRMVADLEARLAHELAAFLLANPGAAYVRGQRRYYSPAFRRFVIDLRERYPSLSMAALARNLQVPAATIRKWLDSVEPPSAPAPSPSEHALDHVPLPPQKLVRLFEAWRCWRGSFSGFCQHVQDDLNISLKRTALARLLRALGVRVPQRRGRPPDERALRQAFVTFFPGAQWVGDGSIMSVEIDGERFTFNLELLVDAASGAIVGTSIRDNEDSAAVTEAFEQAVAATGAPPLALLLDNRPCNHSARVTAGCGPTQVHHAAKWRPQSKGHVEGAFGLFAQQAPRLAIQAESRAELARQVLDLVTLTWARTLNHKPRRNRRGRSRVELYRTAAPTAQDSARARAALAARQARAPDDRPCAAAAHTLLADAARDLAIGQLDARLVTAMARYPLGAVTAAIALYQAKRDAGTLPEMASAEHRGRYLLALVRAAAEEHEEQVMARALLDWRNQAMDHLSSAWRSARESLVARHAALPPERAAAELLDDFADRAVEAGSRLEQCFWVRAMARVIDEHGPHRRAGLYRRACSRIQHARPLRRSHRRMLVNMLAAALVPLD